MSKKLKPCPMCRGKAAITAMEDYYLAMCCVCGVNYEGPTAEDCEEAWNRRTPAEQPAPASTGREPLDVEFKRLADTILQATTNSARLEALRRMAALFDSFAAPVASRELDVEADLRDALEVYAESYDMMARMKEGNTVACTSVAYDIRRNMVDAILQVVRDARSAAQSTAPVSTEQAGDEQGERHA